MSIFDSKNPDVKAVGKCNSIPYGKIPALDELTQRMDTFDDRYWFMTLAYSLGRIHGKREERARRKKSAA